MIPVWVYGAGFLALIGGTAWGLFEVYDRGETAGRLAAEAECAAVAAAAQAEADATAAKQQRLALELAEARNEITILMGDLIDEAVESGGALCALPPDSLRRLNDAAGYAD